MKPVHHSLILSCPVHGLRLPREKLNKRNGGTEDNHYTMSLFSLSGFHASEFLSSSVPPFLLFNSVVGFFSTSKVSTSDAEAS
jgi:hypothetical protein